jgi:hypothetical protein
MRTMINSNMINEYGTMFFESGEGSSPQLHLLRHLVRRRSLSPTVCHRDQQHTLHLSVPKLPHLYLQMIERRHRHLRIGRVSFLQRSLVGQDIHLLIRVWLMIFMFYLSFHHIKHISPTLSHILILI